MAAGDVEVGGVALGAHLYDPGGRLVTFDFHWQALIDPPQAIQPGRAVRCRITSPPLAPGRHIIELDCVASQVAWFAQAGSRAPRLTVDVVGGQTADGP